MASKCFAMLVGSSTLRSHVVYTWLTTPTMAGSLLRNPLLFPRGCGAWLCERAGPFFGRVSNLGVCSNRYNNTNNNYNYNYYYNNNNYYCLIIYYICCVEVILLFLTLRNISREKVTLTIITNNCKILNIYLKYFGTINNEIIHTGQFCCGFRYGFAMAP